MIRTHPQWLGARDIVRSGRIGEARSITGYFSFFMDDPANIRQVKAWGGGGILDIGCYLVNTARMIFEAEPRRVCALIEGSSDTSVDWMASIMMDFGGRHAVGTCSTRLAHAQCITIAGTAGRVEVEIPFNAPPDRPCRIFVEDSPPGRRARSSHDRVRDLRSIHDSGRSLLGSGDEGNSCAVSARGLGQEHAGHRRAVPLGNHRNVGECVKAKR